MTTFIDGPAKGQTLMLRRNPVYLIVTEENGKFDALDQLEDAPKPTEKQPAEGVMRVRSAWEEWCQAQGMPQDILS